MKKIKNAINQLFDLFSSIYHSQFKFLEKLELFWTLLICFFGARLVNKNKVVTLKTLDLEMSSFGYAKLLYLIREIFLLREYQISTPREAPVIIDCGANIGVSVLYFKRLFPKSVIIAFEPNPMVFQLLKSNVEQNQPKGLELYNYFLSDKEGSVEFFVNENKGTREGFILADCGGYNQLSVKAVKLSSFIKSKVDLVKMDIKGAEVPVIEDLKIEGRLSLLDTYLNEYQHNIPGQSSELCNFIQQFESAGFTINLKSDFWYQGSFQDVFLRIAKY